MPSIFHENKLTLKLAFPMMASHLGQMLLGLSDTLMIGRIGTVELAACAFLNILLHVVMVYGIGLSVALSVQVSHAHGAQKPGEAGSALSHALVMAILGGLACGGIMIFGFPLMHHLRQPPDVMAALPGYLQWVGGSVLFMIPVMTLKSFAEAQDHPWVVFWIQFAGVVLNILLNALLIFGLYGFPELGLTGAGLATFISRALTLIALWVYLRTSKALAASRPTRLFSGLTVQGFLQLARLALPILAQMLMEFGAFAASALLIGSLGALPMAAHQIALTCAATTYMLPLGLSGAVGIRVGHVVGAGNPQRAGRLVKGSLVTTWLAMGTFATIYILGGSFIARSFTSDPELIRLSTRLLAIAGVFQIADGTQVVSVGALRGLKDVRIPTLLSLIGYWVLAFPFGAWLGFTQGLGVTGFWIGLGTGLGLSALSMSLRLVWRLRREHQKG